MSEDRNAIFEISYGQYFLSPHRRLLKYLLIEILIEKNSHSINFSTSSVCFHHAALRKQLFNKSLLKGKLYVIINMRINS